MTYEDATKRAVELLERIRDHEYIEFTDEDIEVLQLAIKAMELQVAKKPIIKPLYTQKGIHVDDVVLCGSCSTFVCYPTEHNIEEEYKFCHKCGEKINWGSEE